MAEDRFLQALLAHPRIARLVIADTLCLWPAKVRDIITNKGDVDLQTRKPFLHVRPVTAWQPRPTTTRGVIRAMRRYDRSLRRAAERMGMERPVVITANPLAAGFAEFAWARAITYYGFDDFALLEGHRSWRPLYCEAYDRIRARGIRVGAVTSHLRDRLTASPESVVVPNGVVPEEWEGNPSPPAWVDGATRPLVVYVGTLDGRLDCAAVATVARALPEVTVALVGHITGGNSLDLVAGIPNVEVHGVVSRTELVGLLRRAAVAINFHVYSDLTATIEPQKVYEYLAAGLPVVSTDLPPIRGLSPRVELVSPGGDFVGAIRRALAGGRASDREQREFILANSWSRRQNKLIELAIQ